MSTRDLDIAAPAVGSSGLPLPVAMVEHRDLVDLQLHRHYGRRALDRDETGTGLERLHRPTDGQLAFGVDEHRELAVESSAQELETTADRALARERESVGDDRGEDPVQLVPEDVIRRRRNGELPPP
jgi:hypothetical protein